MAKAKAKKRPVVKNPLPRIPFWRNPAALFAFTAVTVLTLTTLLWSVLSARLQQNNADQLVNPYLFESSSTFHSADFPGAHSFLLKWPIFFIIKLAGFHTWAYLTVTVLAVLATVAILAWVLYRIERRPYIFGVLCLALASVLLMIPAQPYAGGILPVNMAMLATRNLEYAVYIGAVALFVRSHSWRSRQFLTAAVILGLLSASDKLFLSIALAGGLAALVFYSLKKRRDYSDLSAGWFMASLAAGAIGIILLALISAVGITNITSANSPYNLVDNAKDLILGCIYAVMGLATNFGANPAYDATVVRNIPHQTISRLFSLGGPAYIVNFVILAAAVYAAYRLARSSFTSKGQAKLNTDNHYRFGLIMLWSAVAAAALFIFSNHYYAVDSRYLTIALFSLFVTAALWTKGIRKPEKYIVPALALLAVSLPFGVVSAVRTYHNQSAALADLNQRNSLVAQALRSHPVDILAGDYWRVLPERAVSGNKQQVMPLQGCVQSRDILSSRQWQPDLTHKKFAYLLTINGSLTDFPSCNLKQVLSVYGRPNSSILIAGTFSQPDELLLLYDHGTHLTAAETGALIKTPATILPVSLSDLSATSCPVPTSMNIVAHLDDDLLFMNPDILHDIKAGHCTRTIYITAGDAGGDRYYWLSREQGAQAAYAQMVGKPLSWVDRIIKVADKEYVTISTPREDAKISLIFVHLPDGGLKGGGFPATGFENLQKLDDGSISSIRSVDGQSSYSGNDLLNLLSTFMHIYQPAEIRTQSNYQGRQFPDHSDHMAVGRLVQKAYSEYEKQQFEGQVTIPLTFYIGYPVHEMPQNISDGDLQEKEAVFLDYAKYDSDVCHSVDQCSNTPTYGAYLTRQYQNSY